MSYFTSSKYERLMTQIPKPLQDTSKPVPARDSICWGCKRYGQGCSHPCHREVKGNGVIPCGL